MHINSILIRSIVGFTFTISSFLSFHRELENQIAFCSNVQLKLETLSFKLLLIEQKTDKSLCLTNELIELQTYMPVLYLFGSFIVLASVFFIHTTFFEEKIKNLNSVFLTHFETLQGNSLESLQKIQTNSNLFKEKNVENMELFKDNATICLKTLSQKSDHILSIPGVDNAVKNFTKSSTARYASMGEPKVPLSCVNIERLKKLDPDFLDDFLTII